MNRILVGIVAAILFVATVWAANWAVTRYGAVGVGFGLSAPAGVWFVGLALTLRDVTHRCLGRAAVVAAIAVGAGLSYWLGANAELGGIVTLAVASGIAFLVSELADLAVYEPLGERNFLAALVASNIVGAFADSILFLSLAFGSLEFLWGQVVGKLWMTLAAIPLVLVFRRKLAPC